jgi:hypothetical protein
MQDVIYPILNTTDQSSACPNVCHIATPCLIRLNNNELSIQCIGNGHVLLSGFFISMLGTLATHQI